MNVGPGDQVIRPYRSHDRPRVRAISCETAFLGMSRKEIFSDDEILAEALTMQYTDHEPASCLVAEVDGVVAGYLIGSKDARSLGRRDRIFGLRFLVKAVIRGVFFKPVNLRFISQCLKSFLKGEFRVPDFSALFPATLHINIDQRYRNRGLGQALISRYLEYLRRHNVPGVHFGTISDKAKDFFLKNGFEVLFKGERSYFRPYSGKIINFYVMGKRL